ADDGAKEDELLAERVEAAVVEDDGRDRVRRVPLRRRAGVDDRPVAAVEGAEVRQAGGAPEEEDAEGGRERRRGEPGAAPGPASRAGGAVAPPWPIRRAARAVALTSAGYARKRSATAAIASSP